jgi:inner membrane transporter RhtA
MSQVRILPGVSSQAPTGGCWFDARVSTPSATGSRLVAVLLVVGAIVSIQFGTAFATGLFDQVGVFGAVLLRTFFATILLVAIWRPSVALLRRAPLLVFSFGFCLSAVTTFLYLAIDRIPLGAAVTIEFLGPLAVAVATSRRRTDLLWVAMAAAGVWLLTGGVSGEDLDPAGVGFALAAGFFWGAYILLGRHLGRLEGGGAGLAWAMVMATLVIAVPGLIGGGADLLAPSVLLLGVAIAILSAAVPFSLEVEAMRRIPSSTFGVMMSLEPAIAALVGLAVLGQSIGLGEALAIILVVAASAGVLGQPSGRRMGKATGPVD